MLGATPPPLTGIINAAPHLSGDGFDRALAVARRIEAPDELAPALSALQAVAPPAQSLPLLQEALAAALASETQLHHDDELVEIADRIARLTSNDLPQDKATAMWRTIVDALATVPRPDMAAKLRALAPVLERFGGDRLLRETITVLYDVARWFP